MIIRRFCEKCNKEQDFKKWKNRPLTCMQCNRNHVRAWANLHPGARSRWAKNNPEKAKAADKRKRIKHAEKIRARSKIYYQEKKDRIRDANLWNYYRMTAREYDDILIAQGNVCKICGGVNRGGKRLSVDHDHVTGIIRGLICQNCNRMLGNAKDNIVILTKAIEYLQEAARAAAIQTKL